VTPLRLAIVGCGAVAEQYHLPAAAVCSAVELVALADPDLRRANELGERFGARVVTADHATLVGAVDAAIVAVPNRLHAPIASELARAGVHVLVEKPLARTSLECDAIAEAARAGGVVAAVGHDFRQFPVARVARDILAKGLIGEVESVELLQSAGGRWPYASAYVYSREEAGGGVLLDFGVHMLDLLSWWLGDLSVESYHDDEAGGVETECALRLRTAAGAPVHVEVTRLRPMRDTAVVRGTLAVLEIGIFEPGLLSLTPAGSGGALLGDVSDPEFEAAPLRTVFVRQLEDFARAVRTGSEPFVTLAAGRRAVELVERSYAARRPLRHPWGWPESYAAVEALP
jgi:predicted dehydrogenase